MGVRVGRPPIGHERAVIGVSAPIAADPDVGDPCQSVESRMRSRAAASMAL
jgi:hypothetical protein